MKEIRLKIMISVSVAILLYPLIAMQFTNDVNWSIRDFMIMGVLLLFIVLSIELACRNLRTNLQRIIACGMVLLLFFIIWAELAVGIFGSPFAGS